MVKCRRRSGFTLLEVMMVSAIITLIGGLFLTNMRRLNRMHKQMTIVQNLKVLDDAKAQCAAERGAFAGNNTACTAAILLSDYLERWPANADNHGVAHGSVDTTSKYEITPVGSLNRYRGYDIVWWGQPNNMDWILL